MGDSYRPTPSPDLGCVRQIVWVTFYFVILTTFRCVPAFPPPLVLLSAAPSGSICGRGRAGGGGGGCGAADVNAYLLAGRPN